MSAFVVFFFQAEDGIRDLYVTGVQTCALPIFERGRRERRDLLAQALEKDRGPVVELDALGRRTLAVFEAIMQGRHRYGPEAIGYFIVSGAEGGDDMLAALLLARWAEAYDKRTGEVALDIAPQFETSEALAACGDTMAEVLADPLYRRYLE